MLHYETLILSRPDAASDEIDTVIKQFEKIVSTGKGSTTAIDKWGKLRLAYPVANNDYGVYTLIRFEIPEIAARTVMAKITSFFKVKCSETVYRHTTTRLASASAVTFNRPESTDGNRSGNLDSFLKENKIEGFLAKDSASMDAKMDKDIEA